MAAPKTIQAQQDGIVRALDPQENAYRLEIDEFVQNKQMLNLFLLALEALQDNTVLKPSTNAGEEDWEKYWWSYYSIAGKSFLNKDHLDKPHRRQAFMVGPKKKCGVISTTALQKTGQDSIVSMESHCSRHGTDHT